MTCIGRSPDEAAPKSCYITYGVIVLGVIVALVGAFEPQLSGGAYVLEWGAFMGGLLPYLVLGAFLVMSNSTWLGVTAVVVLLLDVLLRLGAATADGLPIGDYGPLALALAAAIALGVGLLVTARRAPPPETPRAVQAESLDKKPDAEPGGEDQRP